MSLLRLKLSMSVQILSANMKATLIAGGHKENHRTTMTILKYTQIFVCAVDAFLTNPHKKKNSLKKNIYGTCGKSKDMFHNNKKSCKMKKLRNIFSENHTKKVTVKSILHSNKTTTKKHFYYKTDLN